MAAQPGWRWCSKCQGLFFAGGVDAGRCPADGAAHDGTTSGAYLLDQDTGARADAQDQWRWCRNCQALFYGPHADASRCPATGTVHDGSASSNYTLDFESDHLSAAAQRSWRWCDKCQGLFFAPNTDGGACPAQGTHTGGRSGAYAVTQEQTRVLMATLASVTFDTPTIALGRVVVQTLPLFSEAERNRILADPASVIRSGDGAAWCTLATWVNFTGRVDEAFVQCRRNSLVIQLDAVADPTVQVLPFAEGSPTAELTLASGVALPLQPVLDARSLRLVASYDPTGPTFDDVAGALRDSGGAALALHATHLFRVRSTVMDPGPHPGPFPRPRPFPPIEEMLVEVDPRPRPRPEVLDRNELTVDRGAVLRAEPAAPGLMLRAEEAAPDLMFRAVPAADLGDAPQFRMAEDPSIGVVRRGAVADNQFVMVDPGAISLAERVKARDPGLGTMENVAVSAKLLGQWQQADLSRVFELGDDQPIGHEVISYAQVAAEVGGRVPPKALADEVTFPDVPRQSTGGWDQINREPDPPLFYRPGAAPEVFYHLPTAYKLGFQAEQGDTAPPRLPLRVALSRTPDGAYQVKVLLVALPFLADEERRLLRRHVTDHVLRGSQRYVELHPRAGLTAAYADEFLAGADPVAVASIQLEPPIFSAEQLILRFTMDAADYGIFVELLRRGIRGKVLLTDGTFSVGVPVRLDLTDLITNALAVQVTRGTTGAPNQPATTVAVQSRLDYPVHLDSIFTSFVFRGPSTGIVLDAEDVDLTLGATGAFKPGAAPLTVGLSPLRLPAWTTTVVAPGLARVEADSVDAWISRVHRDPSLQQPKLSVQLDPNPPAAHAADIQSLSVRIYQAGVADARQVQTISATEPSRLDLQLSFDELAGNAGAHTAFFIEHDARFADGTRSLPQRQVLDLSNRTYILDALYEPPNATYFVDSGGAQGQPMTRAQAVDRINELRAAGKTWEVRAVAG